MSHKHQVAENLAAAFLAGSWTLNAMTDRGKQACRGSKPWLRKLIKAILAKYDKDSPRPKADSLVEFIENHKSFRNGLNPSQNVVGRLYWIAPTMDPSPGAPSSWNVKPITTTVALAEWLGWTPQELDWFADSRDQQARVVKESLRHYRFRLVSKRSGKWRLLEMPKKRLKAAQRLILEQILNVIPPHSAAHGYCVGRSIRTFAEPHCGREIVLRFDLRDFFPSVTASRVHCLFRTAGYPIEVARLLTGLCTNAVPEDVWDNHQASWLTRKRFRDRHLPQGAPTSPALANLCAYRLDCRLQALAQSTNARYTRYADDLAFSGGSDFAKSASRFRITVGAIALEEGFELNMRKSRFLRQGGRQKITGVVVNAHPNVARTDYHTLKAILYNCGRFGPSSQNRNGHPDFKAHLLGRIAHVRSLNPQRGQKLQNLFEKIDWVEMAAVAD